MRGIVVLVFLLGLLTIARGQVIERFSDGDFTNNPSWSGDGADFYVNSSGLLQLQATSAGSSFLSVPLTLPASDSIEWRFFIRQNFSPSSSNYGRIYLLADSANTETPLNGYYLQFGESLSNDAIELFKQSGTVSTSVCRGSNGKIASAFSIYVKVTYFNSQWKIYTAMDSLNYSLEASGIDANLFTPNYFSIRCNYTLGNISNFYFDDIYIGESIKDSIAPTVTATDVISANQVRISFSETIQTPDVSSFFIAGMGNPATIVADTARTNSYVLTFNAAFTSGTTYTLAVSGIQDGSGNVLQNYAVSFIYFPLAEPSAHDIIVSEIYFEPLASSLLPYGEFIELYNRTSNQINLKDLVISDGNSDGILPEYRLSPLSYVILHASATSPVFMSFANHLAVVNFPTLNNDVGDHLILKNSNGEKIDEVVFSDDAYHATSKKNGGWSIERKDFNFPCDDIDNWAASVSPSMGTPGRNNSISGVYNDTISPSVISVFPTDSFHVTITFSEPIVNGERVLTNYRIAENGNNVSVNAVSVDDSNGWIVLQTTDQLRADKIYSLTTLNLRDCAGNSLSENPIAFGFSSIAKPKDVLINEVMSYPFEDGTDYLELVNVSSSLIDLKDWKISEGEYSDINTIRSECTITDQHYILWPGRYVVLSKSRKSVFPYYTCKNLQAFLDVPDFPDYNAEDGSVILTDNNGIQIDWMSYNQSMQFPLLVDLHGVSLERTSFTNALGVLWHSAAATAGYGTPGYLNSQIDTMGAITMRAEPEVFSPDNDGYQDLLHVHFNIPKTGTVVSVYIFDTEGRMIKKLIDGETVANESEVIWNGNDEQNSPAPTGTYVLVADSFDVEGNRSKQKKAIVLIRQV